MNKYLSVKEFAKQAGVSTQAVYQRIDKDLKLFTKAKDGKKTISDAALRLFSNKGNNLVEQLNESQEKEGEISNNLLKTLLNQLEVKDQQIAEKDRQIAERDIQLKELTVALINEQKSAQQAHALHAGTMQQTALLETRDGQPKTTFKQRFSWFKKQNGGTENA